jgi:hypothetical protein
MTFRIQAAVEKTSYRLCISDRSFISDSIAAIFSAEVGWGRPKPRNDIVMSDSVSGFSEGDMCNLLQVFKCWQSWIDGTLALVIANLRESSKLQASTN